MHTVSLKFLNFLKQKKAYVLSFSMLFFLTLLVFLVAGYFPFGKNTIAHYDMYEQIAPELTILFDIFQGNTHNFYLYTTSGGINALSYIIYFIFSPFYFFVLPFGRENILFSLNLVFVLYLFTINWVAVFTINKLSHGKMKWWVVALLGLVYTLSGFLFYNYTYITWLNFSILMPLLILAFMQLKNKGKILKFSLVLFCMIVSCFGVGVFSLIILYGIFILYALLVDNENKKSIISRVSVSYAIAFLASLFVLLPAYGFFENSSRVISAVQNLFHANLFRYFDDKLMLIIVEIPLFCIAVLFFIKADKKDKLNQFLMISLGITLLPVLVETIALSQNMGSYLGYANRLTFIYDTVMFLIAIRFFTQGYEKNLFNNYALKTSKNFKLIFFPIVAGGSLLFIFLIFIVSIFSVNFLFNSTTTSMLFFLQLGLFTLFMIPLIFLFVGLKKKAVSKKFLTITLIILFSINTLYTTGLFLTGKNKDTTLISTATTLTEDIDESYRVKYIGTDINGSVYQLIGVNSFSGFNSLMDEKMLESSQILNYKESVNYAGDENTTLFSELLMGYRYYLSKSSIDYPYLDFVKSVNGLYLYENNLWLSNAYYLKTTDFEISDTDNFVEKQNKIFYALSGDTLLDVTDINSENFVLNNLERQYDSSNDFYYNLVDSTKEGTIALSYTATKNSVVYLQLQQLGAVGYEVKVSVNSGEFETISNSNYAMYNMKYLQSGETMCIKIQFESSLNLSKLNLVTLDYDALSSWANEVRLDSSAISFNVNKNVFSIQAPSNAKYEYVATPYIAIDGFSATINGESVNLQDNDLNFLCVKTTQLANNIVLTYTYTHESFYLIMGAIGIVLAILILLWYKFGYKVFIKLSPVIYKASLLIAGVISVVIYIAPFGIFIYRILTLHF